MKKIYELISKHTVWFILFAILILYLVNLFGVTISNDSVTNVDQISSLDIISRSAHFSFHFFGAFFYLVFSRVVNFSPITAVEIMLSCFSILGSYSLYLVIKEKIANERIALLSLVFYSVSTGIFRFSIQAEYLVLVPSLALITLALYIKGKFVFSGIVLAFGLLTSPFVLLFAPAFFVQFEIKWLFKKENMFFVLAFLGTYILVSSFTIKETIQGEWSYRLVFDSYKMLLLKINYIKVAAIWIYGYMRSFLIILPFVLHGMIKMFKENRRLFFIVIALVLLHLPAAIPESRYGGYQLTVYPFIALCAAFSLNAIYERYQKTAILLIAMFLLTNIYIVASERNFNRELRDTYILLQNDKSIPDSSILFVYQAIKPIQTVYAPKFKTIGMLSGQQENLAEGLPGYSKPLYERLVSDYNNLYMIESGTSMPDDNIKLMFSRFVKNQGAKVKGFGRDKLKPYLGTAKWIRLEKYPLEVYKIEK